MKRFFNFFSRPSPQSESEPILLSELNERASDIENQFYVVEKGLASFKIDPKYGQGFPKDLLQIIFDYALSDWRHLAKNVPELLRQMLVSEPHLADLLIIWGTSIHRIVEVHYDRLNHVASKKTMVGRVFNLVGNIAAGSAIAAGLFTELNKITSNTLLDSAGQELQPFFAICKESPCDGLQCYLCVLSKQDLVERFKCNATVLAAGAYDKACSDFILAADIEPLSQTLPIGLALAVGAGLLVSLPVFIYFKLAKRCLTHVKDLPISDNFTAEEVKDLAVRAHVPIDKLHSMKIKDLMQLEVTNSQQTFDLWKEKSENIYTFLHEKDKDDPQANAFIALPHHPLEIENCEKVTKLFVNDFFRRRDVRLLLARRKNELSFVEETADERLEFKIP